MAHPDSGLAGECPILIKNLLSDGKCIPEWVSKQCHSCHVIQVFAFLDNDARQTTAKIGSLLPSLTPEGKHGIAYRWDAHLSYLSHLGIAWAIVPELAR